MLTKQDVEITVLNFVLRFRCHFDSGQYNTGCGVIRFMLGLIMSCNSANFLGQFLQVMQYMRHTG